MKGLESWHCRLVFVLTQKTVKTGKLVFSWHTEAISLTVTVLWWRIVCPSKRKEDVVAFAQQQSAILVQKRNVSSVIRCHCSVQVSSQVFCYILISLFSEGTPMWISLKSQKPLFMSFYALQPAYNTDKIKLCLVYGRQNNNILLIFHWTYADDTSETCWCNSISILEFWKTVDHIQWQCFLCPEPIFILNSHHFY